MTYMTLAAKYRTSAAGRAAMQEKDLIPALVNWYDKVLKNDVLSEIVKEVNEELDDEDDVRHVDGLATMPRGSEGLLGEVAAAISDHPPSVGVAVREAVAPERHEHRVPGARCAREVHVENDLFAVGPD